MKNINKYTGSFNEQGEALDILKNKVENVFKETVEKISEAYAGRRNTKDLSKSSNYW